MKAQDKDEFLLMLRYMAEVLISQRELTPTAETTFFALLQDLELEDIRKAFNIYARQNKFFPTPADIREIIKGPALTGQDLKKEREKTSEIAARAAVDTILDAARKYGSHSSVEFEDKLIHRLLIDMLGPKGWIHFCEMYLDEIKWWRKDFERFYVALYLAGNPVRIRENESKLFGRWYFMDNVIPECLKPEFVPLNDAAKTVLSGGRPIQVMIEDKTTNTVKTAEKSDKTLSLPAPLSEIKQEGKGEKKEDDDFGFTGYVGRIF